MKYTHVVTFVKHTNLIEYGKHCGFECFSHSANEQLAEHYTKERDVTLNVFYRLEQDFNGRVHILCNIKCPINPLPVKGEFEVPTLAVLKRFLISAGWTEHNRLYLKDAE